MGLIESTIALQNRMTPVLNNVINSMNIVIASASKIENATDNMFNIEDLKTAKKALDDAEFQLRDIENNTNRAKNAQDEYNNSINVGVKGANKLSGAIKTVVATYVSMAGMKLLGGLSDELVSAKGRVSALVESEEEFIKAQKLIYESAQKTGSIYIDQLNTVAKLGGQAKEAFGSLEEVIKFQESINMIFATAGTGVNEAKNASIQLTQALSSGVLRGDELNSIFEQSPQLIRYIAEYLGVPIGKIRELASEGKLSADVVKNAIFANYDEINSAFENTPKTWGRIFTEMKNEAVSKLEPVLVRLNEFANSEDFMIFRQNAMENLGIVLNGLGWIIEKSILLANTISNNWDFIESTLYGIAAAYGAWTVATTIQTVAQNGLNMAILANPIFWFAAGIGIIIMFLARWVRSVGGVQVAHMILKDEILTTYESIQLKVLETQNRFEETKINISRGITELVNSILNNLGNLKVQGLGIIDSFLNGAIDGVNKLINFANNIPGVAIETVEHVTFQADMATKEAAKKKERDDKLESLNRQYENLKAVNQSERAALEAKNRSEQTKRSKGITDLKEKKLNEKRKVSEASNYLKPNFLSNIPKASELDSIKKATNGTEKNTKALKDGIQVKNEDVKYLRDLAERRAIQNFSFDKLEVIANNTFGDVHETADLDGWIEGLTDKLGDAVSTTMGGIAAYE
ncbi:tape measure domain-containing protein [Peptoniphilus asaccharolyticus DSM 20463]|uniref:Tape measure domain-containing protein n=1 Tax=Peptoniphilus asaccharolyticus DSM 20463 TaxID=573058 RepID=A0A1W1V262_PEPAS|nr:tape measure protein [Peptoniphilus asaccharolyticus]MBL7575516.1 tape measure protein [Peptoniphilus asaccharolyticus]SMB87111.1 tape measure domain-containing protein [Peptoniphilus asaccharolyticus DSM 20463]